jgi:hypothetical protein
MESPVRDDDEIYSLEVIEILADIDSIAEVTPNQLNHIYNTLKNLDITMGVAANVDGRIGRVHGKCIYVLDHSLHEGLNHA